MQADVGEGASDTARKNTWLPETVAMAQEQQLDSTGEEGLLSGGAGHESASPKPSFGLRKAELAKPWPAVQSVS